MEFLVEIADDVIDDILAADEIAFAGIDAGLQMRIYGLKSLLE